MKRNQYRIGVLLVAVLLIVGLHGTAFAFGQQEEPVVPEQTVAPEQPIVPEAPPVLEFIPMNEAIMAALATSPEDKAVAASFTEPLYRIELSNGTEVNVDAKTGEVLESKEIEPTVEASLLEQVQIPLEEAVRIALSEKPNRTVIEARLTEEEGAVVYLVILDTSEKIRVDAAGAIVGVPAEGPPEEELLPPQEPPIIEEPMF